MKPLRHPLVPDGRGHRSPGTVVTLAVRDHLLRKAATFFPGSDREAARQIRIALTRYCNGRWRRSRADVACVHDAKRIEATLWLILRVRDHVPSERLIRLVLARSLQK